MTSFAGAGDQHRRGTVRTTEAPCRCRHPRDVHEHLRDGNDCSMCGCTHYRRSLVALCRDLLGALRRAA